MIQRSHPASCCADADPIIAPDYFKPRPRRAKETELNSLSVTSGRGSQLFYASLSYWGQSSAQRKTQL
jgi:hypothetical protein